MSSNSSSRGVGGGILLIGMGVLFLIARLFGGGILANLWPFFVVGAGLMFFAGMLARGKGAGGLAIPGSIVTTVGLILLYQNTFGHWDSWSYVWGLIVVSVGLGLFIKGLWDGNAESRRAGVIVAAAGAVLFLMFGAMFGLGLGRFQRFAGLFWPLALIGFGVLIILRRVMTSGRLPTDDTAPNVSMAIEAGPQRDTSGSTK